MKASEAAAVGINRHNSEAAAAAAYPPSTPMMQPEDDGSGDESSETSSIAKDKTPASQSGTADVNVTEANEEDIECDMMSHNPNIVSSQANNTTNGTQRCSEDGTARSRASSWCQDTGVLTARHEFNNNFDSTCRPRSVSGKHASVIDIVQSGLHATSM